MEPPTSPNQTDEKVKLDGNDSHSRPISMGEFVIAVALLPLSLRVTLNWLYSAVQGLFFTQLHGTGHGIHVKETQITEK